MTKCSKNPNLMNITSLYTKGSEMEANSKEFKWIQNSKEISNEKCEQYYH